MPLTNFCLRCDLCVPCVNLALRALRKAGNRALLMTLAGHQPRTIKTATEHIFCFGNHGAL